MGTINAEVEIAPDVTALTAANAINGIGLHIGIGKDLNNGVVLTELWASTTNNRAGANKQDVVVGQYYFYPGKPNLTYYFWARNINRVGVPNGPWFPASATAGISAKVAEISATPNCDVTATFVGDNTYKLVGEITVDNPTGQNALINLLFQAWQEYTGDADTNFEIRYQTGTAGGTPSGAETTWKTYPIMITKQNNISIAVQKFSVLNGNARRFRLYWKGSNGNVTLSFPQVFETHDYNDPHV